MPSDLAEKVPASSSDSLSWPPAPRIRSPLAGVDDLGMSMPCHSMPTRRTPKSSWAWILKVSSSESSTTFCRGRSSQARLGASSSRPAIARVNGSLPSRPKVSFQRNSILREPLTVASGLVTVAPDGRCGLPVNLGRRAVRGWRSRRTRPAPLHQRDRPAADVLAERAGPAEVIGQRHRGDQRGQLGTQGRLDAGSAARRRRR